ncbi:hypothetical protein [Pseudooceanicola sp.]|uniref:hypothetical protein n=1 Tax=Pseudooceanicola sp. TaxID=1914328 RepID=UPI004057E2FB
MQRHIVITGLPGTGSEELQAMLALEAPDLTVHPGDTAALPLPGQGEAICTRSPGDLFASPDIALAAGREGIRLDLIVTIRDPRDLLVMRDPGGEHVYDGETLVLVHAITTELDRAGIVTGEIVILRAEDIAASPETVRATLRDRLGLSLHPADTPAGAVTESIWQRAEHRDRLIDAFRSHPALHEVMRAQGYAEGLDWLVKLMTPARATAPTGAGRTYGAWGDGIRTLHDDEAMKVTLLDGPGDHAIITFIGVGMETGGIDQQSEEFRKLGPGLGPQIFVFDKARSWGNALDFDLLEQVTAPFRTGREVTALGLSMGGFLAFHAAGLLGASRAIAFAPQFSMCPDVVPFERRWSGYTRQITDWRIPSLQDAFVPGCRYTAIFPNDPADRKHVALFPRRDNLRIFLLDAARHNVAGTLKDHGLLYPTIWACIRDTAPDDMPFPCRPDNGIWRVPLGEAPAPAKPQASSSASQ